MLTKYASAVFGRADSVLPRDYHRYTSHHSKKREVGEAGGSSTARADTRRGEDRGGPADEATLPGVVGETTGSHHVGPTADELHIGIMEQLLS